MHGSLNLQPILGVRCVYTMVKLGTGLGLLHGASLRRWGPYCVSKCVASRCYHRARAWCTRMECIGAPLFLTRLALLQSLTLCASVLWLGSVSLIFMRNPFTWPVLVTHLRVETRIGFYAGGSFLSGCRGLEHVWRTSWNTHQPAPDPSGLLDAPGPRRHLAHGRQRGRPVVHPGQAGVRQHQTDRRQRLQQCSVDNGSCIQRAVRPPADDVLSRHAIYHLPPWCSTPRTPRRTTPLVWPRIPC